MIDENETEESPLEDVPEISSEHSLKELSEIEKLREELLEQKDKYLRLLAETENSRKRMQKDKLDSTRFAVEKVITELLSPLDNFENALGFVAHTSKETQNWAKGFEMILTQLKDILGNHNIHSFKSEGVPFDPRFHEVIEVEETDKVKEGTITKEFVKGYSCGDRVLRPARVKIAKKTQPKDEEKQNTEEK